MRNSKMPKTKKKLAILNRQKLEGAMLGLRMLMVITKLIVSLRLHLIRSSTSHVTCSRLDFPVLMVEKPKVTLSA